LSALVVVLHRRGGVDVGDEFGDLVGGVEAEVLHEVGGDGVDVHRHVLEGLLGARGRERVVGGPAGLALGGDDERRGYQPNPLVSELMRQLRGQGRTIAAGTVAYLVFGETRTAWREHLTYVGFHEGAAARALDFGFKLELFWADEPGLKSMRLGHILRARGINGVIVGPTPGMPRAPKLEWAHFSAVKIGVPFPDLPLPCTVSNHYAGMVRVIEQVRARGWRRLGLVLQEHQDLKTRGMWLAPFALYQLHIRPADRVAPLVLSRWREAEFARWFRAHRPDVVIGLRCELMEWLKRAGANVPRDVGFVHLDRCTERYDCAGLDQKARHVGAAAVDVLAQRLMANDRDLPLLSQQLLVDSVWVDGPTLKTRGAPASP
jgi:LacI family transcriptional regulator